MAKTPRTPQVPGQAPTPPAFTPSDPPPGETLEQKVARLEAENQALKEAGGKGKLPDAEPEAPETLDDQAYREQARGLRAKDVDATRLKRAVLTLDGWVCPAKAPAPPVRE